jgi:preprotein translocase subunit SecF
MKLFKEEPKFKFLNKKVYAFAFSGLIIVVGIVLFFTRGFNLGVDFTGGTNIEVSFRQKISVDQIRDALSKVGLGKAQIQQIGSESKFFIKTTKLEESTPQTTTEKGESDETTGILKVVTEALKTPEEKDLAAAKLDVNNVAETEIAGWLVSKGVNRTTAEATAAKLIGLRNTNATGLINSFNEIEGLGLTPQALNVVKEHTYLGNFTFLSAETVGSVVGHKMRQKVALAAVWALLGMLIYIAFRFQFLYGLSGILTLLHDVLVTLSFILIFQVEFSMGVMAAILTIVGYSINDTIVIFDRVRDNLKIMRRENLEVLLDRSINQTLSRTIFTSFTVLLTVLALFLFGGEVIYGFSFTMLVGVIFGSYSTIYQSCAWLKVWEKRFVGAKKR